MAPLSKGAYECQFLELLCCGTKSRAQALDRTRSEVWAFKQQGWDMGIVTPLPRRGTQKRDLQEASQLDSVLPKVGGILRGYGCGNQWWWQEFLGSFCSLFLS